MIQLRTQWSPRRGFVRMQFSPNCSILRVIQIGLAGNMKQVTNGGSLFKLWIWLHVIFCFLLGGIMTTDLCADSGSTDLPQALREIRVASDDELAAAIDGAVPGDHIVLSDGEYGAILLEGVRGTAQAPILLKAENSRAAIIKGSGRGRNALLSDSEHIVLLGVRFTGGEVWGVTIGPAFPQDDTVKGCRDIALIDCEIDHAGQSLMKINGNSEAIRILDCNLHHSGDMPGARRPYAEGIYVGEGAALTDRSHDILIQNNYIHSIGNPDNWGEAIDIKCQVYDVRILDNTIEDVVVDSGGAITVLYNNVDYPNGSRHPEILIRGNRIDGVRTRTGGRHGAGICIGANGITVKGNVVVNTEGPALMLVAHGANTTGTVEASDNQFEGAISVNLKGRKLFKTPVYTEPGTPGEATNREDD